MAIKTIGFGGTGDSSYDTVSALIKAHAPARYENAINMASPIFGSGFLQKEEMQEDEWEHTIFGGGNSSTSVIRDAGRMAQGEGKKPFLCREQPANIISLLSMGRRAAKSKLRTQKLASLFDSAMEEAASDCGRTVGVQLHGSAVNPQAAATWSGTAADSTVSIDFEDVRAFRPGNAYDFIDTSATLAYVVRCTDVTLAAKGAYSDAVAGTVAFINDVVNPATGAVVALGATAVATNDVFRTRGETAGFGAASTTIDTAFNNFSDLAGSGTLHEQTTTNVGGYRGHTKTLSAAYSQEAVVQFMGRIWTNSGIMPDRCVAHPQVLAAHQAYTGQQAAVWGLTAGISAQRPMDVDKSADKFGNVFTKNTLKVGGADMMGDPNCPAATLALYNSEKTKLAVWDEMGPEEESGDPLLLGRTFFDVGAQITGGYNVITYKRSSNGVINTITGL